MAEEIKKTLDVEETPDTSKTEDKQEAVSKEEQEKIDKIVQARLDRERKKFEQEKKETDAKTETRIKEAVEEQNRLNQLSSEEREKELKARYDGELKEREKIVNIKENRYEAIESFSKAGIPVDLVDFVVDDNKDKTKEKIESFTKIYNDSVAKSVAEKLKGSPPMDVVNNSIGDDKKKVKTSF